MALAHAARGKFEETSRGDAMNRHRDTTRRCNRHAAISLLSALAAGAIALAPAAANAALGFSPSKVLVYAKADSGGTASSQPVQVTVTDDGTGTQSWIAISTAAWLTPEPRFGTANGGQISFKVDAANLAPGRHNALVVFLDLANFAVVGVLPVAARKCDGVCVSVNTTDARHTLSPLLFGTQFEWLSAGGGIWDNAVTPDCHSSALRAGAPRRTLIDQLRPLGTRLLGYPSGIPSDFFNWYEAVGPVNGRIPQINPWESSNEAVVRECPVYGPDEAAELARALDSELLIIANAANGTAADAAAWLRHYQESGVTAPYWEVGNENYISGMVPGVPVEPPYWFAEAHMTPTAYATAFDAFARALREVDPSVQIGLIAGRYARNWNLGALASITEPADFIGVHLLDPSSCEIADDAKAYAAMLTAPEVLASALEGIKADAARYAQPVNRDLELAITEHGTLFFPCYPGYEQEMLRRNRTLASALYSALVFHTFMSDPKIKMAMHVRAVHPSFQAQLTTSMFDGYSNPIRSAFYHVFGLYAASSGDTLLGSATQNSPTFSAAAYGEFPEMSGLPVLHTIATRADETPGVRLYVVNRSLTSSVTARVSIDGLTRAVRTLSAVVVNGGSFAAANSALIPNAVSVQNLSLTPAAEFDFTFPAHSLTVFFAE
jgi:alpha-L-arabinofuranosidase